MNNLFGILNAQKSTRFRKYNFGRKQPFFRGVQTGQVQEKYKVKQQRQKEKRERNVPFPLDLGGFILLEVTLQHALQSLAVSSLVAGHLVDSVLAAQACENVPFGPFSA